MTETEKALDTFVTVAGRCIWQSPEEPSQHLSPLGTGELVGGIVLHFRVTSQLSLQTCWGRKTNCEMEMVGGKVNFKILKQ